MDKISLNKIKTLHPLLREEAEKIYTQANNSLGKNVRLRFTHTYRSFEEQDALYRQRPKVTNAKGGQSYHNYGLAIDICLLIDKDNNGTFEAASWDSLKDFDGDMVADWMEVVSVFELFGWEWGGRWAGFKDKPHFQKTFGKSISTLFTSRANTPLIDNGIKYPKF